MKNILITGQNRCYDGEGSEIPCQGSGQDGDYGYGFPWPEPRFTEQNQTVIDRATGLMWTKNANLHEFPVTWQEALTAVAVMNQRKFLGFSDWRLPNRRELRSLMSHQTRKPSLPGAHPFENIFMGWYWTSTTADINPAYAWYVHLEGARMFYGRKDQYYLFWPVRGAGIGVLPRTGQRYCYDGSGKKIPAIGSGQDGEYRYGSPWPDPRFEKNKDTVHDRLTDLHWTLHADIAGQRVDWQQALVAVEQLNKDCFAGFNRWRLPSINELESLIDCGTHNPALPVNHHFTSLREGYWSSTTSFFETDWAWVLYLEKGACGVGHKAGRNFFVWPVCDG